MSKDVVWEGDSLDELKKFPVDIKVNIGHDLKRVQDGEKPLDFKPMSSIASGVYELRDRDNNGWYRVIYYTKVKDKVHVLHSFVKKSGKTPQKDLNTATERLKNLKARNKQEGKK